MMGYGPSFFKAIISYSSFNDTLLNGTDRYLGLTKLIDPAPHFDLVIVDEAHIRNKETLGYRGVEAFVKNAGAVVCTATPIRNSSDHLNTLLELLRNDIINNKENYRMMAEPNRFITEMLAVVRKHEPG